MGQDLPLLVATASSCYDVFWGVAVCNLESLRGQTSICHPANSVNHRPFSLRLPHSNILYRYVPSKIESSSGKKKIPQDSTNHKHKHPTTSSQQSTKLDASAHTPHKTLLPFHPRTTTTTPQQADHHTTMSGTTNINTNTTTSSSSSFGTGPDADLAARLAAPVSPTTEKASAEARRRTSEWKPPRSPPHDDASAGAGPGPAQLQRAYSFDREAHKHAMMEASGALSAGGGVPSAAAAQGFTERA